MCIRVIERYAVCRCVFYSHDVDPCPAYGRHEVKLKEFWVGYTCSQHSSWPNASQRIFREKPPTQVSNQSITFTDSNRDGLAMESSETREGRNLPGMWPFDAESEGESETSELWDRESVTSVPTTLTIDDDLTDDASRQLLLYGNLKFFWPQLVARCGSHIESCRVIERFLRRFADDLGKLTVSSIEGKVFSEKKSDKARSASAFIRRSRLKLAQRICEEYRYRTLEPLQPEPSSSDRSNELVQYGSSLDAVASEGEAEEITIVDYSAESKILFDTEPICRLEENVHAFLQKEPLQPLGLASLEVIEIFLDEIVDLFRKSRLFKWLKWGSRGKEVLEGLLPERDSERGGILEEELRRKSVSWTCVELIIVNIKRYS